LWASTAAQPSGSSGLQRAQHGVHGRGGIRDKHEILGVGTDKGSKGLAGGVEQTFEIVLEEPNRFGFETKP